MVEEEPQFEVVLKMVLWDEDREAIFHRLQVNKVTGERAEAIYRAARAERVKILRGDGFKALGAGLACFTAAVACYFGFRLDELEVSRFGEGFIALPFLPWFLGFFAAILFGFGIWKVVQGLFEMLFASTKKGSIADR
ncbi:hypothetical protein N9Z92_01865 [Akkermansiaceae bacterium]|jgi:hypothetical protein|nr:hypothetical protein [Akkermansiaceae bacterium]MDA7930455.1 hypothetical protein [Akkermansiaceae bacterium]MDA8976878.1 hypothetical protein [bacterium]MDB4370236.1 hypothetical protein [Akkermansiaceae bacterium]MDB4572631.1 hypothetical protein [Akkermansiaceae bacterium]